MWVKLGWPLRKGGGGMANGGASLVCCGMKDDAHAAAWTRHPIAQQRGQRHRLRSALGADRFTALSHSTGARPAIGTAVEAVNPTTLKRIATENAIARSRHRPLPQAQNT